jgi:hypothetical protein
VANPRLFDFDEMRAFSEGRRSKDDLATIQRMLAGCIRVEPVTSADINLQRAGVDYVATLRSGAEVFVDAKARTPGCRRFWRNGPELQIESWSLVPGTCPRQIAGLPGWTVDEAKVTDLILYTFDSADTDLCFLVGFQPLRLATREFFRVWSRDYGPPKRQETRCRRCGTHQFESEALFVPASEVLDAIKRIAIGQLVDGSMFDTTDGVA